MNFAIRLGSWVLAASIGAGLVACGTSSSGGGTSTTGTSGGDGGSGQGGAGSSVAVTSSSVSSSSGSSSGEGGAMFVDCPESPINFSAGECDVLNPTCPDGKACFPVKEGGFMTTKCITWSGVKGKGAACTTMEECAAGLYCAFYCSPPCCHTEGVSTCDCSVSGAGFGDPKATMWMCNLLPSCNLFVPDTCSKYPGSQCHLQNIAQDLATCAPPSQSQSPPTEGKPCGFINDCGAMQMCQSGVCRYNCLLDSYMSKALEEGGCPDGQTCSTLKAGNNTGVCQP